MMACFGRDFDCIPIHCTQFILNVVLVVILFQSHQRLPSYEEAVHRDQIPDLLQDKPSFRPHHDDQRDDFTHRKYSSREQLGSSQMNGSFERDKGVTRISRASSHGSHSSANTSLEREPPQQQEYRLSDSPDHSPLSSLERSLERTDEYVRQLSHRSSSGSSYSSTHVPPGQSPLSPDTREAVWERLYEQGDNIPHHTRHQRVLERRSTVASSEPSNHITTELPNGTDCNIAELIDPTFNRKPQNNNESSPPGTLPSAETKPMAMPLIQPQRRRSSDKKKKEKEKECKQQ